MATVFPTWRNTMANIKIFYYLTKHFALSPDDGETTSVIEADVLVTDDWERYENWLSHRSSENEWLRLHWSSKQLIFIGIKAN
jgi:hypothetical protein